MILSRKLHRELKHLPIHYLLQPQVKVTYYTEQLQLTDVVTINARKKNRVLLSSFAKVNPSTIIHQSTPTITSKRVTTLMYTT